MQPAVKALTADFVETGLVIYQHHSWPVVEADLPLAAIACLDEHGHKHDWMGFIDVNEYIVLKRGFSVVTLLDSYRAFAAVQLPLQPLIASGPTRPNLLSSHTRCCLREHRERLKSIIQPKYTSRVVNSYEYQHVVGYKVVTPWYMEDDQSVEAHLADAILLYRYEFEATQQRVENPPDQPGGELKLTGYESSDPVSTPGNQLSMLQVSDSRPVNCGLLQKWWTDHTALYGLL